MPEQASQQVDSQIAPDQTSPVNPSTQLVYPLDLDSSKIIERQQLQTKYPQSYWKNVGRVITIKVIDDATVLTTGDGKVIFPILDIFNDTLIVGVMAAVSTVSSSGAVNVQIRNVTDSVDTLSTALTIDASEFDSYTATTPAVINFTNAQLSKSDRIAIDVDGAGTGAKGLFVAIYVQ